LYAIDRSVYHLEHIQEELGGDRAHESTFAQVTLDWKGKMSLFLRSGRISWNLIDLVIGATIFFGSFFVTLRIIDASNINIMEAARRGAWLDIQLDANVCRAGLVGVLRCDVTYKGHYAKANNSWKVIGPTQVSNQAITASYENAPNQLGSISIFGLIAQFDQDGKLSLTAVDNAGTIALSQPIWVRTFFGEIDY
jgi:hypothetical protein